MKRIFLSIMLSFLILFIVSCGSTTCSISSCKKEVYADGLCHEHYKMATEDVDANLQKSGDEGNGVSETSPQNGEGFIPTMPDWVAGAYYIGDTVSMSKSYPSSNEVGYYDITMTDWGTYVNPFIENTGVYVTFEVVNTGDTNIFVSSSDFEAYVNNYSVEIDLALEDDLSATLSPNRQTSGNVYIVMNPDDAYDLELELGDAIFRIQDNSYQNSDSFLGEYEEADLSDFSYNNLYLYGGQYEGKNDTLIFVSIYSSFDEGNILGNVALYDSLSHEAFATIRDDKEGDGIYTLCYDDSKIMRIRFYQNSDGEYYADIQGLDEIYTNVNQIETYIMTEQYIP